MVIHRREVEENDVVRLLTTIGRWPAGTEGTVVSGTYADVMLVEISDRDGSELDMFHVPVELLEVTWIQGTRAVA